MSVAYESKTWRDLFRVDKTMEEMRLEQVDVQAQDDLLLYPKEETCINVKRWENALEGYIVGLYPHIPTLEEHLCMCWGEEMKITLE